MKKYKFFFKYTTSNGTGEESINDDAQDWDVFQIMHDYAKDEDNYHLPILMSSSIGLISVSNINREREPSTSSRSDLSHENIAGPSVPPPPPPPSPTPLRETSRSRSRTPAKQDTKFEALEKFIKKQSKKSNKQIQVLMSVFGQVVQQDYPTVNVTSLLINSSESDSDD